MLFNADTDKAVADNGGESVKFSIHDVRSLMNIRIVSFAHEYQNWVSVW